MTATAVAAWMHYVAKVAYDGATLNDPMAAEIVAQAKRSNEAAALVGNLLALDKIFGADLPANAAFRAAVTEQFVALARNPAVATASAVAA